MDDKKQIEATASLGDEYNLDVAREGFCLQVLLEDIVANKTNTTATATATVGIISTCPHLRGCEY